MYILTITSYWAPTIWKSFKYIISNHDNFDTMLMAGSEEKLKSLLWKWKSRVEKAGLNLSIQKTKIMASGPIISWQIEGEKVEAVTDFIFLVSKITADYNCSLKLKDACSLEGKLWQT